MSQEALARRTATMIEQTRLLQETNAAAKAAREAAQSEAAKRWAADEARKVPSAEAGSTIPAVGVKAEEPSTAETSKGKGRRAENPPASPPPLKRQRRGPATKEPTPKPTAQTATQTQTQSIPEPIPDDYPSAFQILPAKDASALLPQEYDTIFHNIPASWIQVNPSALPDVVFPIVHLPPFLYNLIAFHYEGRGTAWYKSKYFKANGEPIKWARRKHMGKAAILRQFGKYLRTMGHTWNEAYCQCSYAEQDRLFEIQIAKHNRATGFNLTPDDPYRRGLRIPNFNEATHYGVLYGQVTDSSIKIMIDTILSAPSKADLIAVSRDMSSLSPEDAALIADILAELGGNKESRAQGEPQGQGEPAGKYIPADSEEEDDAEPPLIRIRQQPPTSSLPTPKPQHTYIPSPSSSSSPELIPSPPTQTQTQPDIQTPPQTPPSSPLPEFATPPPPAPLHPSSPIYIPSSPIYSSPLPEVIPKSPPVVPSPSSNYSPATSSYNPIPPPQPSTPISVHTASQSSAQSFPQTPASPSTPTSKPQPPSYDIDLSTFFPWTQDPHFSTIPGPLPTTSPPKPLPSQIPPPNTDLDAEFASILANTTGRDGASASAPEPSAPIPTPPAPPTDQPSTSATPYISKASAAAYITPIPLQQESAMTEAVMLLRQISTQLTEIQASQQDGFRELSFRLDTSDVNLHNVSMEHSADFTYHTRRLMNEVSRCFAKGTPHLPSVEERTRVEDGLSREARLAASEALIAAKGEKQMRALNIRLMHENNDLRRQLNLSQYINIPKDKDNFEASIAEAEAQQRMAKAAAKEENDRYQKEKERVDYMRYYTMFEDSDDEEM